jgi:hypothetical protein
MLNLHLHLHDITNSTKVLRLNTLTPGFVDSLQALVAPLYTPSFLLQLVLLAYAHRILHHLPLMTLTFYVYGAPFSMTSFAMPVAIHARSVVSLQVIIVPSAHHSTGHAWKVEASVH